MEVHINMVAVLVALIANFFVGFLWYTVLFGKAWAKEHGFDMTVKPSGGQMAKGMILNVIGCFFLAYVLAHNCAAWSYVPGYNEMPKTANILSSGIFTWLGFFVPVDLNTVAWEKKSWKLFAINTGYHLVMTLTASAILISMSDPYHQ